MNAAMRPYEPRDFDALYDVCVRTAAKGDDLTPELGDPLLPGHLYAGPYGELESDLAFVVEDAGGVGGYIVGTADTAAFEARCETDWFPALRRRYPEGSGAGELDNRLIALIHHPPVQHPAITDEYPAHLHIDLVPRVQGRGWGRALIERFVSAVRARGAPGLHFGVNPGNHRALAFYGHLGFETLEADDMSVILGRRFDT